MARADLLTSLVEFGVKEDKIRFQKVTEAIIAEERAKHHTVLADKLETLLRARTNHKPPSNGTLIPNNKMSIGNLLEEVSPQKQV